MHYILIIGMLSIPFPTYEDYLVEQAYDEASNGCKACIYIDAAEGEGL